MKSIKKIVAALLLSTVVVGSFVGCGNSAQTNNGDSNKASSSSLEDIKKRGTIKIGVFSDKAPFGYVDSEGKTKDLMYMLQKDLLKIYLEMSQKLNLF